MLGEKQDAIEELEKEIDEFTTSVEQNMIKICDHEDILNQQIQQVNQEHDVKFRMFASENQQEIDRLFEQMKKQYEEQLTFKDQDNQIKVNKMTEAHKSEKMEMKYKLDKLQKEIDETRLGKECTYRETINGLEK